MQTPANDATLSEKMDRIFAEERLAPKTCPEDLTPRVVGAMRIVLRQARLESRRGNPTHKTDSPWKWLTWASAIATAGILAIYTPEIVNRFSRDEVGYTGEPSAIRVKFSALQGSPVDRVRVRLPEGLSFHSKIHLGVVGNKETTLYWHPSMDRTELSIIVLSKDPGLKTLELEFLDSNEKVLMTSKVRIHFKNRDPSP